MKRNITFILLFVLMLLPMNAAAAGDPLVVDDAGLLTSDQVRELNALAERVSSGYGMDVAVLTVNSLGGKTARDFADDYYDSHNYHYDGLILVLAIQDREWYISTSGSAIQAFTDYGIDQIGAHMVPYSPSGAYFGGNHAFVSEAAE